MGVVDVDVVDVDHHHRRRRVGVDRAGEPVPLGAGATDHDHAVAEFEPGEGAVRMLHSGFSSLHESKGAGEELERGDFVSVGESGVDRRGRSGFVVRAGDVGEHVHALPRPDVSVALVELAHLRGGGLDQLR